MSRFLRGAMWHTLLIASYSLTYLGFASARSTFVSLPKFAVRHSTAEASHGRSTQNGQKCLTGGQNDDVCTVSPALAFAVNLTNPTLADRLYMTYMAQHVLCPDLTSELQCMTDPTLTCAWNPKQQRCEADKYGSYLLPMSCPESLAHTYLYCMRKPNQVACNADVACYSDKRTACVPRTMLAEAKQAKITVQVLAEQVALGILKGNASVLGSCPEARMLQQISKLCPFKTPWDKCTANKYCTFDVPPYLPRRAYASATNNGKDEENTNPYVRPPAYNAATSLSYLGLMPGPVCYVDSSKLPTTLHDILGVSEALKAAFKAASAECKAAETVWYDATTRIAACDYGTVVYNTEAVYQAAGVAARAPYDGSSKSRRRLVKSIAASKLVNMFG